MRHDDALLDRLVVLERRVEKLQDFGHVGEGDFIRGGLHGHDGQELLQQGGGHGRVDRLPEGENALHGVHQLHEVLDLPGVVLLVLVVQRAVVGVLRVDERSTVVVQA